jgi:hypothetical protein
MREPVVSSRDPVPIGSTPQLDEHFSTERVQIVHGGSGSDLPRPDTLARTQGQG